jgi:hypothetical protein
MNMSRAWRWVVPLTAAAGLLSAAAATPAEAATPGYSVTISATSPHYPGNTSGLVDGYAVAVYGARSGHWDEAVVSGVVTGFESGDVVTLLAEPFKAKSFTATGAPQTLTTSGSYSFTVEPSLATKYEVEVSTPSTHTLDVTSAVQTVYVTYNNTFGKSHQKCDLKTNSCTFDYKAYFYVPASAYKVESTKHLYLYLSQWYSKTGSATWFYLSKTATVSKVARVNAGEYRYTLTFYIRLRGGNNYWTTLFCARDTESKDGLGLPGHHGCGNKRLSAKIVYAG